MAKPKRYGRMVGFRLYPEDEAEFDLIAMEAGVTGSELARELVHEAITKRIAESGRV